MLASRGLPPVAFDEARRMIGNGARAMLQAGLAAAGTPPDRLVLDRLFADFLRHYAAHIADTSRPFPGAIAALDRFAGAGWGLAICTNKLEALSRQLLRSLDLESRFAMIAGQDTFGVRKPDPRHLTETVRKAGGRTDSAVMVGDSDIDVRAARNAGVPVVAVAFGYSPVPVAELGADRVIGHFDELFAAASALRSP